MHLAGSIESAVTGAHAARHAPDPRSLTAALAVLAMLVGLSLHAAPHPGEDRLSLQLSALGLTGADLCKDQDGTGDQASAECPACVLAKALGLAPVVGQSAAALLIVQANPPLRAVLATPLPAAQAPPARAPPVRGV